MDRIKYILGNINLLNIILIGFLVFFVNYTILPFLNSSIHYSLPVMQKLKASDPITDKTSEQAKPLSPLDYIIIAEQNLFHPDRKIPVDVKEAQPLPKPDFVLYGTLITEELTIAYIGDKKKPPVSSPGREKKQTPLKLGESMSGFILKEVKKDEVVMQRGEEKIVVAINDEKARESAAPAGTGTAATTQTPGQPAQTVQQKPPSLEPEQHIRQETHPAKATAGENPKRPSRGTSRIPSPSSGKTPRTGGGGWGGSLSE